MNKMQLIIFSFFLLFSVEFEQFFFSKKKKRNIGVMTGIARTNVQDPDPVCCSEIRIWDRHRLKIDAC